VRREIVIEFDAKTIWIWFEFDIEKLKYENVKRDIEKFNEIIMKKIMRKIIK